MNFGLTRFHHSIFENQLQQREIPVITPKAPLGASELSPAIYRWVVEDDIVQVPEGRLSYVSHLYQQLDALRLDQKVNDESRAN